MGGDGRVIDGEIEMDGRCGKMARDGED